MELGLLYQSNTVVTDHDTALAFGSGDLAVWATPAMLALMENAAMSAVRDQLPAGQTTVGGHIESSHIRPSAVGAEVYAVAELVSVDERKLLFHVAAYQKTDGEDLLLGEGNHLRFIVDKEKFLSKL